MKPLASGRCRGPGHKPTSKAEDLFFTSLSTAEADVFGVKFIGLYGTVDFIAIRDFSFWEKRFVECPLQSSPPQNTENLETDAKKGWRFQ